MVNGMEKNLIPYNIDVLKEIQKANDLVQLPVKKIFCGRVNIDH